MSDQSTPFLVANWFKLFIAAITLLAITTYFYREYRLDECISFAESEYLEQRDDLCAAEKKGSNCDLSLKNPMNLVFVAGLTSGRDKAVKECYLRYSFK